MALPRKLKDFNLFIEGEGYIGRAEEVRLPTLTRQTEDYRGAGMTGPARIDHGHEALEAEITLGEHAAAVLKTWGTQDASGVQMRFLGSAESDDPEAEHVTIEVVMRGRFTEIDPGTANTGNDNQMSLTASLTYYRYVQNGEDLIEIDVVGGKEVVDGEDRMAKRRDALGI
ncbi:phage major tail tube protein [Halorhodospira neutriphila]|uniref:Phage major tail tube protein n=1 Tax=Halorhodospira neutriphila TaxID=168379 RepID=A0ABS1E4N5_9GAMM|nr:phage major tail tube protein [Halorhodospira neutriphila]MBK1725725.1 phage major tail tube protein [Halorhodospira neutriphila]